MFNGFERVLQFSILKKLLLLGLIIYCGVITVLIFKIDPAPILVGIDPYGTRVIREPGDPLIKKERENFLKHFLAQLYNYDSESFQRRISSSGDLMADQLWAQKIVEFERIAKQLKEEKLEQFAEVQELREISDGVYEADLLIRVVRRLVEKEIRIRVEIRVKANSRRAVNPYPYEVEEYDEHQIT